MRAPMATLAMSSFSSLGLFHHHPFTVCNNSAGFIRRHARICSSNLSLSYTRLKHSLVDLVMEELRSQRKTPVSCKAGLTSMKDLSEVKTDKRELRKGILLEFEKDSKKLVLAVAHRPEGKKNWIVYDQNGIMASVRPQQITYIIPDIEISEYSDIADFEKKALDLLDPTIVECAWLELLEKNEWVTIEEVAEIIYGSSGPLESYCTHILLSRDETYFDSVQTRDCIVYEPRPTDQVEELLKRKLVEAGAKKEFDDFIQTLILAKNLPHESKPSPNSWLVDSKSRERIEALVAFGTDTCKSLEQRKTAGAILKAMGMGKATYAAVGLLMEIGYFPIHVNLEVYKNNIPTDHNYKCLLAAEQVMQRTSDPDASIRVDLTSLKVYAIDVDDADELDDALSAERLSDDRIRVWIHVADPASLIEPFGTLDKEALHRGTSVYLPTATYSMFPEKLAMERMSLRQGELCRAVSVSVVLDKTGRIVEYDVKNSMIKPTYMLTYESATELLYMNLEEEEELTLLSKAASLRYCWRRDHGAIDTTMPEARIKISSPSSPCPSISLSVSNRSLSAAQTLVSELMILCNETVAYFGAANGLPLPYRGQPEPNISDEDASAFDKLPAGPVRSFAYVKVMRAVQMDVRNPIRHDTLGVNGYVQFTSPIRRYLDLLAHFQIKAFLRGQMHPFSARDLETRSFLANMRIKNARQVQNASLRYWILEYLRRQPEERIYRALILKFIKDHTAIVLIFEVAMQATCLVVSDGVGLGDQIRVSVQEVHPRRDVLYIQEMVEMK
ncbi:hypothetical protein LUZ60_010913 [Juncus effusus]|nr:hypothetical protein LUZ60_010913 [Juncus effusus]